MYDLCNSKLPPAQYLEFPLLVWVSEEILSTVDDPRQVLESESLASVLCVMKPVVLVCSVSKPLTETIDLSFFRTTQCIFFFKIKMTAQYII